MVRLHLVLPLAATFACAGTAFADVVKTSGSIGVGSSAESAGYAQAPTITKTLAGTAELSALLDAALAPPAAGVTYEIAIKHPQKQTTLSVAATGAEKVLKLTGANGMVLGEWKLSPGMDAAAVADTEAKVKTAFALSAAGVRGIAKGTSDGSRASANDIAKTVSHKRQ